MTNKIVSISSHNTIKEAILKMKKYGFSQLPVIQDNNAVGIISESLILNSLMEKKYDKVNEIMDEAPPVISSESPIAIISNLLKYFSLVLVAKKGKLIGVITKTDVIAKMAGS